MTIEKYQIHICVGAEYGIIGEYSTEEKAVKVLDMIQEDYLYNERCRARGEEAGAIPNYIFVMPQDEEVKV